VKKPPVESVTDRKFTWNRKTWIRVGSVVLFVLIAPFAIELMLLADVVGIEAAIVFVFIYMKSVIIAVRERFTLLCTIWLDAIQAPVRHHLYPRKVYVFNVAASCLALWITGSLVVTCALWLPSLLVIYQYA